MANKSRSYSDGGSESDSDSYGIDFDLPRETQITDLDASNAIEMDAFDKDGGTGNDIDLDLIVVAEPVPKSGQARTSRKVGAEELTVMEKESSNYRITVQRLLWADGKYGGLDSTLVVLKFQFRSIADGDQKPLGYVYAQLDFGADGDDGKGPEVVAWAPFNRTKRTNETIAELTKNTEASAGLQAGHGDVSATANYSISRGVSWPRTYFDRYSSSATTKGSQAVGACWELMQNKVQNQGVLPCMFASVLVTRTSKKPYLAKFTMNVIGGHIDKVARKFGMAKLLDDQSTFRCTPDPQKPPICKLEGKDILKKVDLGDFTKLVDLKRSTELLIPYDLAFEESDAGANGSSVLNPTKGVTATGSKAAGAIEAGEIEVGATTARATEETAATQSLSIAVADTKPMAGYLSVHAQGNSWSAMQEERLTHAESRLRLQTQIIAELRQDLQGVRQDLQGVRQDLRQAREDLQQSRQDLRQALGVETGRNN